MACTIELLTKRMLAMENTRVALENSIRTTLNKVLTQAEKKAILRGAKRIMAIFALAEGVALEIAASTIGVVEKTDGSAHFC